MVAGRDFWWHDLVAEAAADCPAEPLDSETPLFMLYTSGSTGKPKGIKHTTAGYNLFVKKTMEWVFDIRDDDVYWCTADIGWITGPHVRGLRPAVGRGDGFMYEGAPDAPDARPLVGHHRAAPDQHPLHGPDGHPHVHQVGRPVGRHATTCPACGCWAASAKGSIRRPGCGTTQDRRRAMPDRRHLVADRDGRDHDEPLARRHRRPSPAVAPSRCPACFPRSSARTASRSQPGNGGWLVIAKPWPGMLRGIWGDDERTRRNTGPRCRTSISAATTPAATRTAITGSWAASTTC